MSPDIPTAALQLARNNPDLQLLSLERHEGTRAMRQRRITAATLGVLTITGLWAHDAVAQSTTVRPVVAEGATTVDGIRIGEVTA